MAPVSKRLVRKATKKSADITTTPKHIHLGALGKMVADKKRLISARKEKISNLSPRTKRSLRSYVVHLKVVMESPLSDSMRNGHHSLSREATRYAIGDQNELAKNISSPNEFIVVKHPRARISLHRLSVIKGSDDEEENPF